ncbi:MAG: pentapeptide repeat-containing protein [Caldilineaceae bacterium]|nr:pentapeptide repeat-containing protein [Caldilineaceae bacterium]
MLLPLLAGVIFLALLIIVAVWLGDTQAILVRHLLERVVVIVLAILLAFFLFRYLIANSANCHLDCVNVNLMGRDLRAADLHGGNFVEANLRGADLTNADLREADLSGADLTGANLENAKLEGAKLIGTNLTQAYVRGADLRNASLNGADFIEADLTGVSLTETLLQGAGFEKAKLIEVQLQNTNIAGVVFTGANLQGSDLTGAQLQGARLSQADLSGSFLVNADLSGAWLNLATLTGAELTGANLSGAAMMGANLSSAKLEDAKLFGAVLVGAQMQGALLYGADLTSARLFHAELTINDLRLDPVIQGLNQLQKSRLRTDIALAGVQFDAQTTWPKGNEALLSDMLGRQYQQPANDLLVVDEEMPSSTPLAFTMAGSSTVLPLSQALYKRYLEQDNPIRAQITGLSTGIGFDYFCKTGESDIVMASRPIHPAEVNDCAAINRTPITIPVGLDAIAIVVNVDNQFVQDITIQDLNQVFTAEYWFDVNLAWPRETILRFIPDQTSGTFDFFVEQTFGGDMQKLLNAPQTVTSANNNEIVYNIITNSYATGFLGFAFYQQNAEALHLLSVNGISPNAVTVANGKYMLTRQLLLYTDATILRENEALAQFLLFYLEHVNEVIDEVGYFPLPPETLEKSKTQLRALFNERTRQSDDARDKPTRN